MAPRFISEFGLNMVMDGFVLLQDEQVGQMDELLPPLFPGGAPEFHIYVVGSRPRITLDPKSFIAADDAISITFIAHKGGDKISFPVRLAQPPNARVDRLECDWPHNTFSFWSGQTEVCDGKVALFAATVVPELQLYLDLEVLYIGQSYGASGERGAADRLESHSTLQKILGETCRIQPDSEVWLVMFHFQEFMLASFDGTMANIPGAQEADEGRIDRMLSNSISEQQQINFTEAALIRYFEPRFNEMFRKNFPNPAHKTYAECYSLDLNMVGVEIDTSDMRLRLHSKSRPAQWTHFATFPLHDPTERRYMFDLLDGKPPRHPQP